MLAAVRSAAVLGVDAFDVTVEVDAANGLPQWSMVGSEPLQGLEVRSGACAGAPATDEDARSSARGVPGAGNGSAAGRRPGREA